MTEVQTVEAPNRTSAIRFALLMSIASPCRNWFPLGLRKLLRRLQAVLRRHQQISFSGDYSSWDAALCDCEGYDAPAILEKTRNAARRVKAGEAAFERDSVLFENVEYPFPLMAGMLRQVVESGGWLSVMDFGGSLGSSYFQCRSFFPLLRGVRWNIVEQTAHVAFGRAEFETDELRFFASIEECLATKPNLNVVLLSGVLPYLKEPYKQLEKILALEVNTVIIDRTAFVDGDDDHLTVQRVSGEI